MRPRNGIRKKHLTKWLTRRYFRGTFNHMVKSAAVRLDSVFHALADPTRRQILRGLASNEKTVGEIARPHKMSLAAVSKHLKVLEGAELIARERRGSFQIVKLKAQSLKPAEEWIAFYSRYWNQQFDQLEQFIEGEQR